MLRGFVSFIKTSRRQLRTLRALPHLLEINRGRCSCALAALLSKVRPHVVLEGACSLAAEVVVVVVAAAAEAAVGLVMVTGVAVVVAVVMVVISSLEYMYYLL